ncbi:hypothetical protein ACFL0H_12925 [Thermodesulfobacteriota bacterium]
MIIIKEEIPGKGSITAVAAIRDSPFAGPAPAVFRSATDAWKKTCGDLPAAELTGSALIAGN